MEHTIGLLKGTFQSLKEIRVQLVNIKWHKIIIMWARVCIILHNLIIRIEGDNFDEAWREHLCRAVGREGEGEGEGEGAARAGADVDAGETPDQARQ